MFSRKAYEKMLEWKRTRQGRSALLIEGARRVGKSTLVEEFAKNEYLEHLLIDFSVAPNEIKELFSSWRHDLDTFFKYLFTYYGVNAMPRDTLIVFDEVQHFPTARESIKQFVADGRYDFIETGSLISIRKNVDDILIPSEEEPLELVPFDFEEFLWATGENELGGLIREARERLTPLPEALHKKSARLFREYMLVGGMPQVISSYVNSNSFSEADVVKRQILNLYRNDIAKYAGSDASKVAAIFDSMPGQLSKAEKKFALSSVDKNARMKTYEEAFFWLSDARITNICHNSTDPGVGLGRNLEHDKFKCYMADTGLLVTHAFADSSETTEKVYRDVLFDKLSVNEGMLTENVVSQAIRASGRKLFFYSAYDNNNVQNRMEIDFLITEPYKNAAMKQRVCPIEVKSEKRYGTKSLTKFKNKFGSKVGTRYILHPKQIEKNEDEIRLPLYMAPFI